MNVSCRCRKGGQEENRETEITLPRTHWVRSGVGRVEIERSNALEGRLSALLPVLLVGVAKCAEFHRYPLADAPLTI